MQRSAGLDVTRDRALLEKMRRFHIRPRDIQERFIHSQGPGGMNVNKTSTCVYLKHIPTGIEVKCQEERSQAQNRFRARVILVNKIEQQMLKDAANRRRSIEKLRRQQRKRSAAQKRRMLEDKRRHAQKKSLRQRPDVREFS
ncbi:MAG: peptide chain release factor-like protein [Candidatus Omnitrophica bacterium]|nr:peptide chain release factor-like protein [Candidatus Omnitrophota bacterium]